MSAIETEKKEDLKVKVEASTCSSKSAEEKAAEAKAQTCSTDAAARRKSKRKVRAAVESRNELNRTAIEAIYRGGS